MKIRSFMENRWGPGSPCHPGGIDFAAAQTRANCRIHDNSYCPASEGSRGRCVPHVSRDGPQEDTN
jgi:hypothetical protein